MQQQLNDATLWHETAFIQGQWLSKDKQTLQNIYNPANQILLGAITLLNEQQVHQAIDAAKTAQQDWQTTSAHERAKILKNIAQLIHQHTQDLAQIITAEQGKPITESRAEALQTAAFFEWFGEEAIRVYGDIIPAIQTNQRILVMKQAVGVCAAITPWNFPLAMIARKLAPALAAGCTMLIKPAPQTPFSALALADLCIRAGLPADCVSVLLGDAEMIGGILTSHTSIRKITFTGSTQTGRKLMAQAANTIKRISLELGGNAPFIVFADSDLGEAVAGVIAAKFRNAGQTCVCANRIFVETSIYDAFVDRLTDKVKQLRVGFGTEASTQIGPLINPQAMHKVKKHLQDALEAGAILQCGGSTLPEIGENFFAPTVLTEVTSSMTIAKEETFGPIAPIIRFTDEAHVIQMANDSEFGLAAYVYTQQLKRAWRLSEALEYGMVGLNTGIISTPYAPFGGIKQSGIGREGSKYGIDEYINLKYVCLGDI